MPRPAEGEEPMDAADAARHAGSAASIGASGGTGMTRVPTVGHSVILRTGLMPG